MLQEALFLELWLTCYAGSWPMLVVTQCPSDGQASVLGLRNTPDTILKPTEG